MNGRNFRMSSTDHLVQHNNQRHWKVVPISFHSLNGHNYESHPQTKKIELASHPGGGDCGRAIFLVTSSYRNRS